MSVTNVATGDFLDYFYINYYGCDVYGYGGEEEHCTSPMSSFISASLYFTSLVVIVGNIMVGTDGQCLPRHGIPFYSDITVQNGHYRLLSINFRRYSPFCDVSTPCRSILIISLMRFVMLTR